MVNKGRFGFRNLYSLAATLSLLVALAACNSGLHADDPNDAQEPSLTAQDTGVSYRVPYSDNDAEQSPSKNYNDTTSSVLELGDKESTGTQQVGLRFAGVQVPKGATIVSAKLEFTAVTDKSGSASLSIRGIDAGNTPDFSDNSNLITSRPRTSANTTWSPSSWSDGSTYQSPSLVTVVREITSRSDWSSGNAMGFVIDGTGLRKAQSYDGNSSKAPRLLVTYDVASTPTPTPSCLEGVNRTVANPQNGVQYTVQGKGTNAEIDARGKNFFVRNADENGRKPLQIQNNGSGLCFSGGKYDTLVGDGAEWEPDFHFGPAIRAANSPSLVMDNLTVYLGGDAIVLSEGMNDWTVRDSYIRHAGDDAFENDQKFSGTIDDVLVDWAYQGVSCDNKSVSRTAGTVTIKDSLFALKKQKGTYNNHKDGTYPANPGHLHPFKWQSANGERNNCKLRLKNTIIYLTQNGGGQSVFDSDQEPTEFVTECEDVTIVYVGGTTFNDDEGRLAALRNKFGADCFKIQDQGKSVSTKLAFWRAKRDDWFARHSDNSQISYYRNREPQGEN